MTSIRRAQAGGGGRWAGRVAGGRGGREPKVGERWRREEAHFGIYGNDVGGGDGEWGRAREERKEADQEWAAASGLECTEDPRRQVLR